MTKPKYSLGNNLRWWRRQMRHTAPGLRWGLAGYVATTALTAGIGVILPAWLVQLLGNRAHYGRFVAVAISLSTVVAVSAALNYFCAMYGRNFSGNVRARVSIALHDAALNLDYARLQQPATERLFHQATTNGTSWTLAGAQAIYIGLARLLASGVTLVIFAVLLGLYLPWLFALIVLAAAVAYWGQARYRRWYAAHNAENARYDQQLRYLTRSAYAPENGKDARLYPVASWHHEHLLRLEHAKMGWQRQNSLREFGAIVLGDTAGLLRDAGVYIYLVVGVVKASLSLARFTLLFGITNQFVTLTSQLLEAWHTVQKASVDLQELRAFLSLPAAETATVPADAAAALAQRPVTIQFTDVSYRYPGAKTDSLQAVSFTLHAGEHLALVGLNGAGKSTLAKLMMGLLTPTSGSITYNGVAATDLPPAARFALFAPVFQESAVLALTIAENVAMSQSPDPLRVANALAAAKLTDLVAAQPNGADTPMTHAITDAGVSLSGGQTQRLMLARAVYKDAPVLILDEPTAALDALAESALYQEYTALSAGKSAVFISHRLASTRFCDRILVLAQGELVAAGTHDALLAQGGLYADLYRTQSQYYQQEAQDESK